MSHPLFADSPSTAALSTISIASTWRSVRIASAAAQVQTSPVSCTSSSCGPDPPTSSECQTTDEASTRPIGSAAAARSAEPTATVTGVSSSRGKLFDVSTLTEFVQRAEASLSEMLMENLQSSAFDDWPLTNPLGSLAPDDYDGDDDDATPTPGGLLTLSDTLVSDSQSTSTGQSLIAAQRSKSGSSLILAYGHPHGNNDASSSPWCTHMARLAVILNGQQHTAHLQLNACPTSISVHPDQTSLVAVGTWPGDVLVWDANGPDSSTSVTSVPANLAHLGHADAVAKTVWVPGSASWGGPSLSAGHGGSVMVMGLGGLWSAGTDGSVVEWRYIPPGKDPSRLEPVRRGTVGVPSTRASSGGLGMPLRSLAIHSDPMVGTTTLLLGSDAGHVVHVDARRLRPLAEAASSMGASAAGIMPVMAPHFKYASHTGAVNAIEVHPHVSSLFVSVGQDGKVHVHRLFRDTSLLTLRPITSSATTVVPLLSAAWSPLRPGLLAVSSTDGVLLITVCGPDPGAVAAQLALPCTDPLFFHPTLPLLYVGAIENGASGMRVVRLAASALKLGDMEVRMKEMSELTRLVGGGDGQNGDGDD